MTADTKPKRGRPCQYAHFVFQLEEGLCYSPGQIVRIGLDRGLLAHLAPEKLSRICISVRHSLARLARSYPFPPEGDGLVKLPGQARAVGWLGARWKRAMTATHSRMSGGA